MNVTNPQQTVDEFEKRLKEITQSKEGPLAIIEKTINLCSITLMDLKQFVVENGFNSKEGEIYFFKQLKPKVYSKFIYYSKLFKLICRKPTSTVESQEKYLRQYLKEIEKYYNYNFEFYQYYKRGLSFLDEKFFTRGSGEIPLNIDNLHFLIDKNFSTMQDYNLSTLIANEMLTEYIKGELEKLGQRVEGPSQFESEVPSNLTWTGSKTALTELIYALCSCGVINNGKLDIKELVVVFEKMFDINLGDIYHIYLEIRNRKIDRVKFLDTLKQSLLNRMDDADGR